MEQISDSDETLRVIARVKPTQSGRALSVTVHPSSPALIVGGSTYAFDEVCDASATQERVWELSAKAISDNTLSGYNGTIFAYGQTGSGKTHTIYGPADGNAASEQRGILPRTLDYVFKGMRAAEAKSDGKVSFSCRASFLEIYNERIYDLLDSSSVDADSSVASSAFSSSKISDDRGESLSIREHKVRGIFVEGLTEVNVATSADAFALMLNGTKNRTVAATLMNRESSRSHSVFTLVIEATERASAGVTKSRLARFNLIDLAGSERQKLTQAAGVQLKEAGQINKSLSALGGVIQSLVDISQGKSRHVHYRDSKLTMLLKDSLGGNSKTVLIATLSPTEDCLAESLSTLKFAQRAKLVRNKAIVNEDTTGSVAALQAELKQLKAQLLEFKHMEGATKPFSANSSTTNVAATTELYRFGDGILACWDSVLEDLNSAKSMISTNASAGAVTSTSFSTDGVISRAKADGSAQPNAAVTALTALSLAHRKLSTMLGVSAVASSPTLSAASIAFERLTDLEEKYSAVWAEKEEADLTVTELQAHVDRLRDERASFERLAEEQRSSIAAIESKWEALLTEVGSKGVSVSSETQANQGSSSASTTANVSSKHGAATTGSTTSKTTASSSSVSTSSSSALLQPGFKGSSSNSRRGSVTTTHLTTSTPQAPPTTHASKIAQPGFKRRPSVTSETTTTLPTSGNSSRRPSTSANSSSSSSSQIRRPSVSMSLAEAASAAAAAEASQSSSASAKDDVQRLLEGLSNTMTAMQRAVDSEREIAEMRAERERLRQGNGQEGMEDASLVRIQRSSLNGLINELSSLVSEITGLREHIAARCDPAVWIKAKDRAESVVADVARQRDEIESVVAREWEKIATQRNLLDAERTALDSERSEGSAREAELEATNCELQAELEGVRASLEEARQIAEMRLQECNSVQVSLNEARQSITAIEKRERAAKAEAAAAAKDSARLEVKIAATEKELIGLKETLKEFNETRDKELLANNSAAQALMNKEVIKLGAIVTTKEEKIQQVEALLIKETERVSEIENAYVKEKERVKELEEIIQRSGLSLAGKMIEQQCSSSASMTASVPLSTSFASAPPCPPSLDDDIAASMNRAFAALNAGLVVKDSPSSTVALGTSMMGAEKSTLTETSSNGSGLPPTSQSLSAAKPAAATTNVRLPFGENVNVNVVNAAVGPKAIQQQFAMAAAARVALKKGSGV
jgi:hypothetical protein